MIANLVAVDEGVGYAANTLALIVITQFISVLSLLS